MTIPRAEYPRPQLVRPDWVNLNGDWEFEFDYSDSGKERKLFEKGDYSRKILVPFCPESSLSGIGYTDFIPAVWYRRTFSVLKTAGRVLIHFGAVDYHCEIWVNGSFAGAHDGGYCSFSFDITDRVTAGENTLVVYAKDDLRSERQPSGKQSQKYASHGCYYTRTTGIWQTVWLEFVPTTYIQSLKITPNTAEGAAEICILTAGDAAGYAAKLTASFDGKEIGAAEIKLGGVSSSVILPLRELHLWDVGQPNLYDLTVELIKDGKTEDSVTSYFGMRSVEVHGKGVLLNGRKVYQRLVLDQGFYPDGIYTAPNDESLIQDIKLSMALGFNGARLHQRVFEERFLYHADKLGYLVWGEYANWGLDVSKPEALEAYLPEWTEAMQRDYSHPSIVCWCPFNETWDVNGRVQDNSVIRLIYQVTKQLDKSRPVVDTSGNYHVETDIYDIHDYEQDVVKFEAHYAEFLTTGENPYDNLPKRQSYGGEPYMVSEYGGAWWDPTKSADSGWGYGKRPESEEDVIARYEGLTKTLLTNPNICGFCYTQLYDVEQEKNGLYTYARGRKFSEESYRRIKAANEMVAAFEKSEK